MDWEEGIFPHKCKELGCERIVQYDDEPWCFTHSPDSGSSIRGYSARAEAAKENEYDSFEDEYDPF